MFEASSVYIQYVNERAAHVKIDRVSHWCRPVGWHSATGVLLMKIERLLEFKDDFSVFL